MQLIFSKYLGTECTRTRANRLNTYDGLRYLQLSTKCVPLLLVLIKKKKKKKSPLVKPWNRNDWKSWKGYICTVSSIVDQKCINVFISPNNVYSVDQSEPDDANEQ